MSEKKRIRPYTLKYWMGKILKNMFLIAFFSSYFLMAFYYIISKFGGGENVSLFQDILVLGDLEKNRLISEVLVLGSQWCYYISILLSVQIVCNYPSMVMLPLSMGSTRREAYVGYELGGMYMLLLLNLHSLLLAYISKAIVGESLFFSLYPAYLAVLISISGMVKLLYGIQFYNHSKLGALVKVMLACYVCLVAVGMIVHHMFFVSGEGKMEGLEWLYVLMAFIGVLTWFIGGKITLKKSKNIEVTMLFS
ncbi:MAG: hypothetical protein IJA32_06240 [Lachnospiraceae bacterium]|nr:hypothetical protein [Lachnospiraceae bacterium]